MPKTSQAKLDSEPSHSALQAALKERGWIGVYMKLTSRMKQIIAFMREYNGVIEVIESGESVVTDITIYQPGKAVDDQWVSGKVFGSCTEYMIEKLCKAKLIEEDEDGSSTYLQDRRYQGCKTSYRLVAHP